MKFFKKVSSAVLAVAILGNAAPAFAAVVEHEVDDAQTAVTIEIEDKVVDPETPIDPGEDPNNPENPENPGTNPDVAVLELVSAPTEYNFTSSLQRGIYTLNTGEIKGNYGVWSDAKGAHYEVRAAIDNNQFTGNNGKKIDVTSFSINGQNVMSQGNQTVMSHVDNPFEKAGSTNTKSVDQVGIEFKAAEGTEIEQGDMYTGSITNTLYNIYSVAD